MRKKILRLVFLALIACLFCSCHSTGDDDSAGGPAGADDSGSDDNAGNSGSTKSTVSDNAVHEDTPLLIAGWRGEDFVSYARIDGAWRQFGIPTLPNDGNFNFQQEFGPILIRNGTHGYAALNKYLDHPALPYLKTSSC